MMNMRLRRHHHKGVDDRRQQHDEPPHRRTGQHSNGEVPLEQDTLSREDGITPRVSAVSDVVLSRGIFFFRGERDGREIRGLFNLGRRQSQLDRGRPSHRVMPKDYVSIRARDKTTGKDLILRVPKNASMEQVMEEYTRKFNEQEGKAMNADEFRFVSNGKTVERASRIEELPTGTDAQKDPEKEAPDEPPNDIGCGSVSCAADQSDCSIM